MDLYSLPIVQYLYNVFTKLSWEDTAVNDKMFFKTGENLSFII